MKFFRIVFLASILLSLTGCDFAYWDCKREMIDQGYEAGDAARSCRGK